MNEISIINNTYDFYKSLIETTSRIEKRFRYSLASKIEEQTLDLLQNLIMAKHAPKSLKAGYLIKCIGLLENIRLLLRMCLEINVANETNIFKLQENATETGRMLGGWLRSLEK
jgi:hypothetical protein